MFAMFKQKNNYMDDAARVYAVCLLRSREAVFYEGMAVPDSFDGRFDLLCLHVFLVMDRLGEGYAAFNQALFDVMFQDMDQTLREMGIGDMGVPKHQKKMMMGFNGRMESYATAARAGREAFGAVLRRNVYGTVSDVDAAAVSRCVDYVFHNREMLQDVMAARIVDGDFEFMEVGE